MTFCRSSPGRYGEGNGYWVALWLCMKSVSFGWIPFGIHSKCACPFITPSNGSVLLAMVMPDMTWSGTGMEVAAMTNGVVCSWSRVWPLLFDT